MVQVQPQAAHLAALATRCVKDQQSARRITKPAVGETGSSYYASSSGHNSFAETVADSAEESRGCHVSSEYNSDDLCWLVPSGLVQPGPLNATTETTSLSSDISNGELYRCVNTLRYHDVRMLLLHFESCAQRLDIQNTKASPGLCYYYPLHHKQIAATTYI